MNDDKLMRQFSVEYQYRSHGQHTGEHVPQRKSGRVMGPAEISGRKKLEVGRGVPDHLAQANYAEICILTTKYISKLNKIQNTNCTSWV